MAVPLSACTAQVVAHGLWRESYADLREHGREIIERIPTRTRAAQRVREVTHYLIRCGVATRRKVRQARFECVDIRIVELLHVNALSNSSPWIALPVARTRAELCWRSLIGWTCAAARPSGTPTADCERERARSGNELIASWVSAGDVGHHALRARCGIATSDVRRAVDVPHV